MHAAGAYFYMDGANFNAIVGRLKIADLGVVHFMIDHGFVKSLYMRDPDGLTFEMAVDPADYDEIMAWQAKTAHETLRRWNAGDYTPNNNFRDDHTFRNVYTERE